MEWLKPSIESIEVHIDELQKTMDTEWATASSAVTDRLRRPVLPNDFPKQAAAEQRRKRWMKACDDVDKIVCLRSSNLSSPRLLRQRVSSTQPDVRILNDFLMPKLTKATETMIFVKNFDLCGGTSQH